MSETNEVVQAPSLIIKDGQEWTFDMIDDTYNILERIWKAKYKRSYYPNQLEIISSEQMLDAYSAVGMPLMYTHWSYGEQFIREQEAYKRGYMGLAYEIVINSEPCIAYLMEENTMLMQALVIAHANFGHNTFFKNNYLFKQWTDAGSIIDYLAFAKKYIASCEEKYGIDEVESLLDAAHSLQHYGVDKYKHPPKLSPAAEEKLQKEREQYVQSQLNDLWRTVPKRLGGKPGTVDEDRFPKEPQENLLYFIEKNAPRMEDWKREIIRIVRKIAQYFYPQGQTKLMNEGCATYFHYKLIHDLYDEKIVTDGALMEFYHSHTGVIRQLDFDHKYYSGLNPYALGFAMYQDIERIAMNPTEEDREWFGNQEWVGSGDYLAAIDFAIAGFKDESFIQQFLSPKVIRDFKMFSLHDDEADPKYLISAIHNKQGYKAVREALAKQYNFGYMIPDIQVTNVDRWGDRTLTLNHYMVNKRPLDPETTTETLRKIAYLWGYSVKLNSVDESNEVRASFEVQGDKTLLDVFLDDGNSDMAKG
jgi:stage V sporulation protein R